MGTHLMVLVSGGSGVATAWVIIVGLLQFVEDGDVVEGEWPGNGRVLVAGCWSLLLLGPWQPRPVLVFRGGEGEREREIGMETHLVVLICGDGGVATSTYAIARASPTDLVMWLCHIVVVVGRCTGHWGQSNDVRQWLLEVEVVALMVVVVDNGNVCLLMMRMWFPSKCHLRDT